MSNDRQMTVQQALDFARAHHTAGRFAEAEAVYRQILAAAPDHPQALHRLGVLAHHCGNHAAAIELIQRAISLNDADFGFHHDIGEAYRALGQLDHAARAFRRALELNPRSATSHSSMGIVSAMQGKFDHAIGSFKTAVRLDPTSPEARNNLGNALSSTGDFTGAVASLREAIRLRPQYVEAIQNLGSTLLQSSPDADAAKAFQEVLRLNPRHSAAHAGLAIVAYAQVRLGESIELASRAIALNPNQPEAWNALGNAFRDQGELEQALHAYQRTVDLAPTDERLHSNLLLTLHGRDGNDPARMFDAHVSWAKQHAAKIQPLPPRPIALDINRKLRIGYVSGDFRVHSVAFFLEPLLAGHDRQRFEVTCYSDVKEPDEVTARLRTHVDRWREIFHRTVDDVAQQVRADEIDILVDLGGHASGNRMLIFACKPAPIQVTLLGYPNTTGLRTIDFRMTDAHADPPGMTEAFHTEKLIRLPRTAWCYRAPEVPAREHQKGPVTFGSFNQLAKLSPQVIAMWSKILHAVTGSKLLLKTEALIDESTQRLIMERFAAQHIGAERLRLLGRDANLIDHFIRYNDIDIALDTFPYHGTTTTCDALWMGVPVITLAGRTHVSRVGVSLLSNVGMPDLIANTEDEYIAKAVALANDAERLAELHSTLRARMQSSPLMNEPQFAADVESAYRKMWQDLCQTASLADTSSPDRIP